MASYNRKNKDTVTSNAFNIHMGMWILFYDMLGKDVSLSFGFVIIKPSDATVWA